MTLVAPTLQRFFTERLANQRQSPRTIASYRDSSKLLVAFGACRDGQEATTLSAAILATISFGYGGITVDLPSAKEHVERQSPTRSRGEPLASRRRGLQLPRTVG